MMVLGWADLGLGGFSYGYLQSQDPDRYFKPFSFDQYFWGGFGFDVGLSMLIRMITYTYLASKWEGYQRHNYYKCFHLISIIFISMLPHGDFLL